jgi:hypothetical protein
MFGNPHILKRASSNRRKTTRRGRGISLLLLLAIGLGSATQLAPSVEPAPPADITIDNFHIATSPIPSPMCADAHYRMDIFVQVDTQAKLGDNFVELEGGPAPSISVTATSSNTGVIELNPDVAKVTGFTGLVEKSAEFGIKTGAIGRSTLTFVTKLEWRGQTLTIDPLVVPITTVHCNYKVVLVLIQRGTLPDTVESVVANVDTKISEGQLGTLDGEGQVKWTPKQATPCLIAIQNISNSKAKFTGHPSPDGSMLQLHVSFDPSILLQKNTLGCGASGSGSYNVPFQPTSLDFELPTIGGAQSIPATLQIGDAGMSGTAIITVIPIPNE